VLRNGVVNKAFAVSLGAVVVSGVWAVPPAAGAAAIAWAPCPADDPVLGGRLKGLECGRLTVPLNYARPTGRKITLALTRARHTGRRYQGVVLLNRGGPGAQGRDMPSVFSQALPKAVADSYDWIGMDPRGVGASTPALVCDPAYQDPGHPRPEVVPTTYADETAWRQRAGAYAEDCRKKYGRVLRHMGTDAWVRDLEEIRLALGRRRINFFGYSYGSYLGAAYATKYPDRVRRMVLDSVVRPSGVWYEANLDQNVAFEKRIQAYFRWIARHHRVYGLGARRRQVERAYYQARAAAKAKPINDRIGAVEFDEIFLSDGYTNYFWPGHARALADYVLRGDGARIAREWSPPDFLGRNNYTVYSAVQCRDAAWPRDWTTWHRDNWRLHNAGYRFMTWSNAWYNAPCAFWPVAGGPPPAIGGTAALAPILLVQATEDAATPYQGAVETHRLFPSSRLLVQRGGGNHGVTFDGDKCVDGAVAAYFGNGAVAPAQEGADAFCTAPPPPKPTAGTTARTARPLPVNTIPRRTP
jgi:pimeloyl-ACP methyl ester carboxylesterase